MNMVSGFGNYSLNKSSVWFLVLFFFISSNHIFAQPNYSMKLSNGVKVDENTIEFDVIKTKDPKNNNNSGFSFSILSTTKPKDLNYGLARPGEAAIRFGFEYSNSYIAYDNDNSTPDVSGREELPKLLADKKYRISIWVQKERIRLYVDEDKLFDLPKVMSKKFKYNMIRFDRGTAMIANLRIATGLPDMRSKLLTEGKLISYGIYFDINKDVVNALLNFHLFQENGIVTQVPCH